MTANSSLGSVVSRLQGLKNVGGRRVMPGEEEFPVDESVTDPEAATRSGINYGEMADNLRAGGVAPPYPPGYDVRANSFAAPQEAGKELQDQTPAKQNEPGFWSNIGENLTNFAQFHKNRGNTPVNPEPAVNGPNYQPDQVYPQTPPVETAQVDVSEGLPPTTASQEQAAAQQAQNAPEGAPQVPGEQVEAPKGEPLTYAEPGAIEIAMQNPEFKAELERLIGEPITPEMAAETQQWQTALSTFNESKDAEHKALTENEQAIKERIESRNLSSTDKIFMTLALLAPAILAGATMGKEGFFGVLEGTAGATANVLGRNAKNQIEDEDQLSKLAVQKGKIGKERLDESMKMEKQVAERAAKMPNKDLRDLTLRDGKVVDGKIIFETGNEKFPLESSRVRSPADLKNFKEKALPKLEAQNSLREQMSDVGNMMNTLLDIAEKQRGNDLTPTITSGLFANTPWLRDEFEDENGNLMKFNEIYKGLRQRYGELNRQFYGEKGTGSEREKRFENEFPDPFSSGIFQWKSKIPQTKKQLKLQFDGIDKKMISDAKEKGVNTKFLEESFKKSPYNSSSSEEQRKANRAKDSVAQVKGG